MSNLKKTSFPFIACLLATIAAIPVVSGNIIENNDGAVETLSGESYVPEGDMPKIVERNIGPNSFQKTVETSHGNFAIDENGPESKKTLLGQETKYVSNRNPDTKTETVEGVDYRLEIYSSSEKKTEVCTTPEGTYKKIRERGSLEESFEGVNEREVIEKCEEAEETLSKRRKQVIEISRDIGLIEDEVEINEINSTAEYIEFENTGKTSIQLEDWKVKDNSSLSYTFEEGVLKPGETAKLKSGDLYEECEKFCWSSASRWAQSGDIGHLLNTEGETMDVYSYGG